MLRLALYEDCTLPDFIGCWFKAKQLQRKGSSLWLHRAPGNWGNPGLSPWATGPEALPASSGPLRGTEALSLLWATGSEALPGLFRTSWGHSGPPWVPL